jgi:cold shock CspA family protein
MRFDGKLDKWNDDRGFGFISPLRGGERVFVHISAFPCDGTRPRAGETLTFEVEGTADGKKRAVRVERPGARPRARQPETRQAARRPRRTPSLVGAAIAVALVAGGGFC